MQSQFSLSMAFASASSLVLLQLFSRLFTFVLNQALVRLVSPQVFGTAAIQFELLLSTILFLSREGVRNALLRAPPSTDSDDKKTAHPQATALLDNVSLLPVLIGVPMAIGSALLYVKLAAPSTASQPRFHASVAIYALAAFCELLSEPLYIRAQNGLRFDLRVKAEGVAIFAKTVVTFLVLVTRPADWALMAFAFGQAAYGLATLASYVRIYRSVNYWPHKVTLDVHGNTQAMYFDPAFLHLSMAMTGQSVVKHFLTEGDKFLVSRLSPLADQGGYAIASNYGSLVARIIFQPIEETSRLFFSKTLTSARADQNPESLRPASGMLMTILLLFTHLFLVLVAFGPPYLPIVISLLLPSRFRETSAPVILGTYIYYIPAMAFNGVLEAFLASTSTSSDLHTQSRWMVVFSLGFVAAAIAFTQVLGLGDAGLVWANVVNLLFRAAYAWRFVRRYFTRAGAGDLVSWRRAVPPGAVLAVFVLAAALTRWSAASSDVALRPSIREQMGHIALGVAAVLGCASTCFVMEKTVFVNLFASLRRR